MLTFSPPVQSAIGANIALTPPKGMTRAMSLLAPEVIRNLPHDAELVLDRAGWHSAKALEVPANITFVLPLPFPNSAAERQRVRANLAVSTPAPPQLPRLQGLPPYRSLAVTTGAGSPVRLVAALLFVPPTRAQKGRFSSSAAWQGHPLNKLLKTLKKHKKNVKS